MKEHRGWKLISTKKKDWKCSSRITIFRPRRDLVLSQSDWRMLWITQEKLTSRMQRSREWRDVIDSICIVVLELVYYQLQSTTPFLYPFHKWDPIMWFRMFSFIWKGSLTKCVWVCMYVCIYACKDAYRIHNNSEQDIQSKFKFPFEHQIFGIFFCFGCSQ